VTFGQYKASIIMGNKFNIKAFSGLGHRSFNAADEKVPVCLPSKHKNEPSFTTETIE
jgi:hypothetical protein